MLIGMLRKLLPALWRRRDSAHQLDARLARAVELHRDGHLVLAEADYRALLASAPDQPAILNLLGHCLTSQRRFEEAVAVLRRAVELTPDSAETQFNLASACKAQGDTAPALAALYKALQLKPDFVEAHANAAELCKLSGDYAKAESHYRKALELAPDHAPTHCNFAMYLHSLGEATAAIVHLRRAVAIDPAFALAHANLVAVLSGAPAVTASEIFCEQTAWASKFADPLKPRAPHYANTPDPSRRLRIGYVSPDLRRHPLANFFEPLLVCHDRTQFEICCYDLTRTSDAVSQRLRDLSERWVECANLNDAALAQRIRDDRIDILVDLSGHTKDNRLTLFARKPAPVQFSYLGYPTSTGIAAIDYRISDYRIDPAGADIYSAEQVVRLPDTYFCFRQIDELPDIESLPALRCGHITFGSFNNVSKLNADAIELWSQVLRAIPTAKLFLKTKILAHEQVQEKIATAFAQHGIAGKRLVMRGWEAHTRDHLVHYNNVDIALDPTSYSGVTTTCEGLLMGVPTVTLCGETHLSRMGTSLLHAAGLPELVTTSRAQFVDTCVALAHDLPRLARLRMELRRQMQASRLMDEYAFTRALECAYRERWRAWCEQQQTVRK